MTRIVVNLLSEQKSGRVQNVPGATTEKIYQDMDDIFCIQNQIF